MTTRAPPVAVLALVALAGACDGTTGGAGFNRPRGPRADAVDAATDVDRAAAGAPSVAPAAAVPVLTAPAGSLDGLYAALAAAERGDPGARARIAVFGDSHTAGDGVTGRLREVLQARFGDAGRGLVAAGKPPYRHYYQRDVGYGSSGAWRVAIGGHRGDAEPFGLLGFRVDASRSAEAWVETCAACRTGTAVSRFELLYWVQPGGGELQFRVDDGGWQTLSTAAKRGTDPRAELHAIDVADGAHRLTVRRGRKGVVTVFGIGLDRDRPGVEIDGLGVVGRRLGHLHGWDWSVIGAQLAARAPRLVVLQYGTNEADDPALDLARVAAQYDEVIARIRAILPAASVLVLGPPDMGVRAAGKACDDLPVPDATTGAGPIATTAGVPMISLQPWIPPECRWRTPAVLAQVIEVQRAAAARAGVAFFDSFAALGGADRMDAWATADPRLAGSDRVHFTAAGAAMWADALLAELLAGYDAWRAPGAGVGSANGGS
jgi:lysophospholipase L1-like esterase